mmetsp:Transcript_24171/g.72185  ORF Transcript_24171/g.72185 Transcript_24171/m.72185 type:complete len:364 (-) Transcript_24171:112-1203(-)
MRGDQGRVRRRDRGRRDVSYSRNHFSYRCLWSRRGQRGRAGGDGPRDPRRGAVHHGFVGRSGEHDGRDRERLCDRVGRAHFPQFVGGLQGTSSIRCFITRRDRSVCVERHALRRHAALHVRGPHDDLRRQGRRRDHHGGPRPIPQPPRPRRPGRQDHPQGLYYYGVERRADSSPHGRHSRQQQMCGYQYQVVGAGDDRARRLRDPRALVRGLLGRSPLLGGYVGRWHWKWCHGRDNDEQRRRRLGQREEVHLRRLRPRPGAAQEGRQRQLDARARRGRHGRHGRRPLQGHVGAGPEHPHQVDEHGQSHDCSFTEDVRQALGVLLLGLPAARFVRGLDGGAGLHRNINVGGPHRQDARRGREKS